MNATPSQTRATNALPISLGLAGAAFVIIGATGAAITATLTGHTRLGLAITGLTVAVAVLLTITTRKETRR